MKQIAFILSLVALSSCKYNCNEFPESDLKYISYNLNDTIKYFNNDDTIIFIVTDYYMTEGHTVKTNFPIMDLSCEKKANYQTSLNTEIDCYIEESYDNHELFKVKFSTYNIYDFSLLNDNQYGNGIISKDHSEKKEIDGRIYFNCFTLKKSKSDFKIWQFVKADSFGIVEFHHSDYEESWKLIH